ncbi:MAG TPA: asparagine synthase-related protein [Dongiaceae bacterium]|nr:asparagine synthase-related protein [Dongiaceae bacterium]
MHQSISTISNQTIERVVDLTEPAANRILNMSVEEARERIRRGPAEAIRVIEGSFALVAKQGKVVRLARSLDRPMRYFLAKRHEGPALVVAHRIDAIWDWLKPEGLAAQFHPSYTRMVPAHHVVQIHLVGCPDPDPIYERFFAPQREAFPADLEQLGQNYVGALAREIRQWLGSLPAREPIGVCFSGGVDSGAVFLLAYHSLLKLGMNPARLKAFTLSVDNGPDLDQSRTFLDRLGLGLFLEVIEADPASLDPIETIRIVEDYKSLDVESATMALALCRGIRRRYPDWRFLMDGDGGDENLKDYPIEENPELTIRSVVNNRLLYQEGWGLGTIKHSLTYSGGFSRSCTRSYAPARHFNFEGFSPFTRPAVIEQAEGIPFIALTGYEVEKLYRLKGEVISRGVKALTSLEMPVFPKRRFQHGAVSAERFGQRLARPEPEYRQRFLASYVGA